MKRHAPRFLRVVDDAKTRIREIGPEEVKQKFDRGDAFQLMDVREESEWAMARIPGALHIGKGVLERDIEGAVPDPDTELVLYCGGGYRSALAADSLQRMGYTNVRSLAGGIRGWIQGRLPLDRPPLPPRTKP